MFGFSIDGAFRAAPYVLLTGALLFVYNRAIDNPHVRALAEASCAARATDIAADAKIKELTRQLEASKAAEFAFKESYRLQRDALSVANDKLEKDIADNEREHAADTTCPGRHRLRQSDIDRLRG